MIRLSHPDAAVGDTLPEAVGTKKDFQFALPDAASVAPAGHVADDEEDQATAVAVGLGVAVVSEPHEDGSVEQASALRRGYGGSVEVGSADVDGGLVRVEDRGEVRDEAVGNTVGTAGEGLNGDAE